MSRVVCGIDPGASGAIGVVTVEGRWCCCQDLPVTERLTAKGGKRREVSGALLAAALRNIRQDHDVELVVVERVASRPGEGSVQSFSFGFGVGVIHGVLATLGLPFSLVTPQAWKKAFGLGKDKEGSRLRALQLFPEAAESLTRKRDEARAEALLIALHATRKPGAEPWPTLSAG